MKLLGEYDKFSMHVACNIFTPAFLYQLFVLQGVEKNAMEIQQAVVHHKLN